MYYLSYEENPDIEYYYFYLLKDDGHKTYDFLDEIVAAVNETIKNDNFR